MSRRVTLTEVEIKFIRVFISEQMSRASTDPHRGVLTVDALAKLDEKLTGTMTARFEAELKERDDETK